MIMSSTKVDAFCYGFKAFSQLSEDPFFPILNQLEIPSSTNTSVKFIVFSWSKCNIILSDGCTFTQGFIGSSCSKKRVHMPYEENSKKILCLNDYDLFVTEEGSCWKYFKDDKWQGPICFSDLNRKDIGRSMSKIMDISSDTKDLKFVLFDSGVLVNQLGIEVPFTNKVKKICCGFEHNVCLLENGSVYVWGSNSRGQLGIGSLLTVEHPQLLEYVDGLFIIDIDAGGWHTAALSKFGDLYTWGWNSFGQLGFSSDQNVEPGDSTSYITVLPEPKVVEWPNNLEVTVKQIACGNTHTIALCDDGVAWGCGSNKYGQINPLLQKKSMDEMCRVPVADNVSVIHSISCSSWNTVLYVLYKDHNINK